MNDLRNELRLSAEKFCQDEIAPLDEKCDQENKFPEQLWKKLGDMGFLGMTAEEEFGGSGLGYYEHCLVTEEISKASGSIALSYIAHSNLCINQIRLNGNQAQKKKYLPKLCSGDHVGALAMSEPGAGSDVTSMKLRAEKKGNKYILNGSKMWITNGPTADTLIIYAKTNPELGHRGITAFIVEKGYKGFSVAQKLDKFGMRGSETGELVFEDCEVPEENILGELNKGVYVLMKGLDYERLILSAGPIGLMQRCMDLSVEYANERKQFDQKIGDFQIIQAKMADMFTKLQSSRAFLYSACQLFDAGAKSNRDSAAIFLHCSKYGVQVALECMQIFGGNGYINEYPCGRILRDAKLYEIGGGTNEIRQWLIGRELMKEETIIKREQEIMASRNDGDLIFRFLQKDDFDKGYMPLLAQLTVIGTVTKEDFEKRYDEIFPGYANFHKIVVIEDKSTNKVIGTGTIFMEKKFIRQCGTAGHIEDVSLDENYRGRKLGLKLVEVLKEIGLVNDCYKIMLDCNDKNLGFYEKNGFKLLENCVAWYRSENKL